LVIGFIFLKEVSILLSGLDYQFDNFQA